MLVYTGPSIPAGAVDRYKLTKRARATARDMSLSEARVVKKTCETTVWLSNPADAGTKEANYHSYHGGDMSLQGWYKVATVAVEFTEPTREQVIPTVVKGLKGRIEQIRADAFQKERQIQHQIEQLLSIGFDAGSARIVEASEADDDIPF